MQKDKNELKKTQEILKKAKSTFYDFKIESSIEDLESIFLMENFYLEILIWSIRKITFQLETSIIKFLKGI